MKYINVRQLFDNPKLLENPPFFVTKYGKPICKVVSLGEEIPTQEHNFGKYTEKDNSDEGWIEAGKRCEFPIGKGCFRTGVKNVTVSDHSGFEKTYLLCEEHAQAAEKEGA